MLTERRFELLRASEASAPSTLADDVRRGLASAPRSIPPKHFYDAAGSELFDRICDLPEYYLTRAEHALLERVAPRIADRTRATALLELGSGMARKTAPLLFALSSRARAHAGAAATVYVPLDISIDALEACAASLVAELPGVSVRAVVGEFPRDVGRMARAVPADASRPRLFAFLGSTMGNLDEVEAPALVRAIAEEMAPRDAFLLGIDLVKDARVLLAAYDDAQGVTALFNKNVLVVINRELGADFDVARFSHVALYDEERARIEMHLRSEGAQRVHVAALGMTLDIADGERIRTEISRKFTRASAEATLAAGGMVIDEWFEEDATFALVLARRARRA